MPSPTELLAQMEAICAQMRSALGAPTPQLARAPQPAFDDADCPAGYKKALLTYWKEGQTTSGKPSVRIGLTWLQNGVEEKCFMSCFDEAVMSRFPGGIEKGSTVVYSEAPMKNGGAKITDIKVTRSPR